MSDAMSDGGDTEQIAKIGKAIVETLDAEAVIVRLLNGGEIAGAIVGYALRKKPGKAGKKPQPANWAGNVRIQTEPGVLEVDCLTIESITPKTG